MLSLGIKKISSRSIQNNFTSLRNVRRNGSIPDAKAARAARKDKIIRPASEGGSSFYPKVIAAGVILSLTGYSIYSIRTDKNGFLGKAYWGSYIEQTLSPYYDYFFGWIGSIFVPYEDKLLPDWPTDPIYNNVPPGTPCPPCLILDLEKTLIGSEHSVQYGWRHVKRPGLDQLLEQLSNYYEIVIFSENDVGVVQELLMAIDPESRAHKLGSTAAECRDGVMLKRLDLMNRDISKIILIDDSLEASQLFPRNTLLIKPFIDVGDKGDTALLDLIPLLQAFIHDQSNDFRDTIDDLGTHEAEEACIEYRLRVANKKREEEAKRNRGLGGLIRNRSATGELDTTELRTRVLSSAQIVGAAPKGIVLEEESTQTGPMIQHKGFAGQSITTGDTGVKVVAPKKKGQLFQWLDETDKEREEHQNRKNEKMNEIYGKRMFKKAQLEEKMAAEKLLAEGK